MTPFELLSFLGERAAQKRIAAVTAVAAVIGVAYAFAAPKWFQSTLTVVPARASRTGGGLSALLGSDAAGLGSGLLDGGGPSADANRIAAVLQSVVVTDALIEKFDLKARYKEKYQETTREEVWRHCAVKTLVKPQLVELSCEDRDPKVAQEMVAFFAEFGNKTFRRISVSTASEEVRFLEKRVLELRQAADDAAGRMREFQERHRIVDLDSQAKAVVASIATLNTERIAKQLELEYTRTFAGQDEPSLRQLRSQLAVVNDRMRSLEDVRDPSPAAAEARDAAQPAGPVKGAGAPEAKRGTGMFPAALEVPKLRSEFEKLYRDRRVAEATLVFALERLESAKASEARDSSTFVVLDPPTFPTHKARPSRLALTAIFALLGLVAGLGYEARRSGVLASMLSGARRAPPRGVSDLRASGGR